MILTILRYSFWGNSVWICFWFGYIFSYKSLKSFSIVWGQNIDINIQLNGILSQLVSTNIPLTLICLFTFIIFGCRIAAMSVKIAVVFGSNNFWRIWPLIGSSVTLRKLSPAANFDHSLMLLICASEFWIVHLSWLVWIN